MAVLIFSIFFTFFLDHSRSINNWEMLFRGFIRFVRFTFLLCLPLFVLLPLCTFVVARKRESLLQVENKPELCLDRIKHWVFRPFQGIGIGLLFETKLLVTLQIITGVTAKPYLLFPRGQFQPGRLLIISAITVVISLLLSTLWTLDDMGIRYISRKNQEIKMLGKYLGTLMPIIFGFYGVFSLIADYPAVQVINYLFKTVIILYPPFTVFTILHLHFIMKRGEYFSQKISLNKVRVG